MWEKSKDEQTANCFLRKEALSYSTISQFFTMKFITETERKRQPTSGP